MITNLQKDHIKKIHTNLKGKCELKVTGMAVCSSAWKQHTEAFLSNFLTI